jgi:hypothetical protein
MLGGPGAFDDDNGWARAQGCWELFVGLIAVAPPPEGMGLIYIDVVIEIG